MPPRGDRPGFKRGRHGLPYWIASQVTRDPKGYPDKCIPLPPDADDETLGELCREHSARLFAWIDAQVAAEGSPEGGTKITPYDGTMLSACRIYQEHPYSRFHKVKSNTRDTYTKKLRIIETSIGKRLIRNCTLLDAQHWYDEWRKPAKKGGPERVDQAHDCISMVKTVLRFNSALRRADCRRLLQEIEDGSSIVHFEKGGAREQEMTYAQVAAFIRKAIEIGNAGTMPVARARALAIGVAAQFELLLRQKDIIGEYAQSETDLEKAQARGASVVSYGTDLWTGYFVWERIPGWRWRLKTSKSKYRAAAEFDLSIYSLLHPLLEAVPHEERTGPIIKDETGRPMKDRLYAKRFRLIARAAGIPDEVWNMDTRAGGATEADDAGATIEAIQDGLTHSKKDTTLRYIRRRKRNIVELAKIRKKSREGEGA